ncbi:hypothetical protein MKW94_003878 [Papaver nudicaule]|uniref:S1-like domain-containing protein n=1 Tax=Papaver nudicaule TaxID=74823 RepID=A0AA41S6V0_PAPNU|nr:hypothetical protein [Papaver nudicaule]
MGRDTIADIITSIRIADMDKKGTIRIASTNITENIVKILLREGFIENVRKQRESNKNSWNKKNHEGLITESLPNGMFRVHLDNEDPILGYVSGRIRRSFILILPGDKVKIEVSRYDSTR